MFSLQTESVGARRTIHQGFQSRRNETNRKDVPPTTLAFFLGLGFDTVTMEFWVPLDKAQIFATSCKELRTLGKATRREIAAVVGKLMWCNPAIFNVKLLSKGLQHMTGGGGRRNTVG